MEIIRVTSDTSNKDRKKKAKKKKEKCNRPAGQKKTVRDYIYYRPLGRYDNIYI